MADLNDLLNSFRHATFLIDTCFYIDAFSKPNEFKEFIFNCSQVDIAFVSISLVRFEFIHTKSLEVKRKKEIYFDKYTTNILPTKQSVETLIPGLIEEYKEQIEGVSVVDLYLAAMLKSYKNLYLLTRNHSDFPTNVFTREAIFPIEAQRDIKTYAVYSYKPKKEVLEEEVPF